MVRTSIRFALFLCLTALPAIATAGEVSSSLDIQGFLSTMTYSDRSPLPSTDKGLLPGGALTYTRQGSDRWYVRLHADVMTGTEGYTSTQPRTSLAPFQSTARLTNPATGRTAFSSWRGEGNLGYTFVSPTLPTIALTPYGGVGYRQMTREAADTLDMTYQWLYLVGGVRADWFVAPRWRTGLDLTVELPMFMKDLSGTMMTTAGIQRIGGQSFPSQPGFRASLPTTYRLNKDWGLTVTPTWEHVTIGGGKSGFPGNSSTIMGTYFGIRYNF